MEQKTQSTTVYLLMAFILFAFFIMPTVAQEVPPAEIVNDEGGPATVTGSFPVSNPNIIDSSFQAIVILEDQAGFVDRNFDYAFPIESQVVAAITPFQVGTVEYTLSLPIEPKGAFRDVDNDDAEETGVQIFQIAWWDNMYGDILLEKEDAQGWSGAYSTARVSEDPETLAEYIGGSILVWTPDDEQGFPNGFGEDGLLFTEDDPIVALPAGWTTVDMDTEPFTFDRSREIELPLIEPEGFVPDDFSDMSYADAFNALIDLAIEEYSFTELKDMDWEALREEFLPRFEQADEEGDPDIYQLALRDFAWSIPDGHVQFGPQSNVLNNEFVVATDGGLGISAVESTDGRFLVNFLLEGGPADEAGIELLAELIAFDGRPVAEAMQDEVVYSQPFSTEEMLRVQQLRYLLASPVGTEFEVTFLNPDATEPETVTLTSVPERESFSYSSINRGRTFLEPQIWFEFIEGMTDAPVGYIQVTGFSEDGPLLIETWEEFLGEANANGSPAIVIDLRFNGGGFSSFATRMASYFHEEVIPVRYSEGYNEEIEAFFFDERFPVEIVPPLDTSLIYDGDVIVLIGQSCASACEFFAYDLGVYEDTTFVGQYATQGIAGGWPPLYMPDGVTFALPTSRDRDFDGNIILEGIGVQPDVRVPINEVTIMEDLEGQDVILNTALDTIVETIEARAAAITTEDGGDIALDETVEGELTEDVQRIRYAFSGLDEDMTLDFLGEGYLRVYIAANEQLALEAELPIRQIDIPAGLDLFLEIGSEDDEGTGAFTFTVQEYAPIEWEPVDGGKIALGESVEGDLESGIRVQYTFIAETDSTIDISATDETGELDTYLRIYGESPEDLLYENDDIDPGVETNSVIAEVEVAAGEVLVIEVGGFADDVTGTYTLSVVESGADE